MPSRQRPFDPNSWDNLNGCSNCGPQVPCQAMLDGSYERAGKTPVLGFGRFTPSIGTVRVRIMQIASINGNRVFDLRVSIRSIDDRQIR